LFLKTVFPIATLASVVYLSNVLFEIQGGVTDATSSEFRSSTTFGGGIQRCYPAFVAAASHSYSPHLRRSLPALNHSMAVAMSANSAEPPKLYPYHLLMTTNYRLPGDVDRLNLEVCTRIKNKFSFKLFLQ